MSADPRLTDLVSRWERLRGEGATASVESLCRDCPELADQLREQILALEGTDACTAPNTPCGASSPPQVRSDPLPAKLGRYSVEARLGAGGFGVVYRGYDDRLERLVAIKVPHAWRFHSPGDIARFLQEGRHAARLDHPSIVPVYDVGQTETCCYIVYKLIEGSSLADRLCQGLLPHDQAVHITAEVAEALAYAHQQGLYHRDIKPGNILLDRAGKPYIADFGVAVREQDLAKQQGLAAGTFPYMAPEQVRGEGHRIDGRADVYSLGIVLYELLTGRRPFEAESREELVDQILHREAKPLRQVRSAIPRELDRICLRAISKRVTDRYPTAGDMAEELRLVAGSLGVESRAAPPGRGDAVRDSPAPSSDGVRAPLSDARPRVVPKGLRSFGPEDSEFFLELVPGPRDGTGLPTGVRFWKRLIEERDPDATFAVGLLYGPSGCGKSSLVRAGLLPRVAPFVRTVYVEATREDTEARLARALGKACPGLDRGASLRHMMSSLRIAESGRDKILIVLDQFEQWLHGHSAVSETELATALRQCDGGRLQCLLLVRDDFWLAVSRFMRELEIPLVEGRNIALVDLFDATHARRVLAAFGRAYGRLPETAGDETPDQKRFLDQAIAALGRDGKVIPVQLSLFADMLKGKPWTPETLRELGGIEGVGLIFLEETFGSRLANPEHRGFQRPARAVLGALLPESGTDIKGRLRSTHELAAACDLAPRSREFLRLLEILDRELHIVSPTDVPEAESASESSTHAAASTSGSVPASESPVGAISSVRYQLTHDYLVPPLRAWLHREKRKTWRGRVALRLEERTMEWRRSREHRLLPSLSEYLSVLAALRPAQRTVDQRELVRAAGRYYSVRGAAVAMLLLAVLAGGGRYIGSVHQQARRDRAADLVKALLNAPPEKVAVVTEQLAPLRDAAVPLLEQQLAGPLSLSERLHAIFALGSPDGERLQFLLDAIADAPVAECGNLVAALAPRAELVRETLRERSRGAETAARRARYAITALHLGDPLPARERLAPAPDPVDRAAIIHGVRAWRADLAPFLGVLEGADDPDLRSGLCIALGTISSELLARDELDRGGAILNRLFLESRDGPSHSAAGWALRQWGRTLPPRPNGRSVPEAARWFVNQHGMTLIEIPAGDFIMGAEDVKGATPHRVRLSQPFCMCDRETSVALFEQFMADTSPGVEKPEDWPGTNRDISPGDDHPVQPVSWLDAILFCNWLSDREGRQRCYLRTDKVEIEQVDDKSTTRAWPVWSCDFDKDGYRLPTEAEWEYACRAGTHSHYEFGDPSLVPLYAVFAAEYTEPCASRMPSRWGLFDMYGNIREWCYDRGGDYPDAEQVDPMGDAEAIPRVQRGGCWADMPRSWTSPARMIELLPIWRASSMGFRVVRSGPGRGAAPPAAYSSRRFGLNGRHMAPPLSIDTRQ